MIEWRMERQISFCEMEYSLKDRKTRKELFLEKIGKVLPLERWCAVIKPYYYEKGNGREPTPIEVILKMYLVSNWFNMSDETTEDSLYENITLKNYVGGTPDATTLCRFRKILERNRLTEKLFKEQTAIFRQNGLVMHEGTIVDATIIESPKQTEGAFTYKNKQRYYGTKAHIGADKKTGIVHSVVVTPANIADIDKAVEVLHGEEKEVYADAGYVGLERREDICAKYQDGTGEVEKVTNHSHKKRNYYVLKTRQIDFQINGKRSKVTDAAAEQSKSKIRNKVEHAFCILKHRLLYRRTKYKTLAKNTTHLYMLFTLVNLCKVC